MKKKNTVLRIMREEYRSHLDSILKELDVFNSKGELIIGTDLKVVHDSGYEYTVKSVDGPPGKAKITLRTPETPRDSVLDPTATMPETSPDNVALGPPTTKFEKDDDDDDDDDKVDRGVKAYPKEPKPPEEEEENVFVIDQAEFEKHYKEA